LLEALDGGGEDDDDTSPEQVVGKFLPLVEEAAAALRASRDWPLLEAALDEAGAAAAGDGAAAAAPSVFLAAGLGSLGQYRARLRALRPPQPGGGAAGAAAASSSSSSRDARRRACPRAGIRLFQLALARLLLLRLRGDDQAGGASGASFSAIAADPDYDAVDARLLEALGFSRALSAPAAEALLSEAPDASSSSSSSPCSTFCYMPLCPRDAYDDVLSAFWSAERLPLLQIFGTSFGAQGETSALVAALSALGGGGGLGGGPPSAMAAAAEPPSEKQAMLAAASEGVMVEVPAPDFACHGVGVAVHAFSREGSAAFFAKSCVTQL
jgi:hypothetical protein